MYLPNKLKMGNRIIWIMDSFFFLQPQNCVSLMPTCSCCNHHGLVKKRVPDNDRGSILCNKGPHFAADR